MRSLTIADCGSAICCFDGHIEVLLFLNRPSKIHNRESKWFVSLLEYSNVGFSRLLEGNATRPTSDRLKETLFNLLQAKIEGSRFLDCFAGSGSVGIEATQSGCSFCGFP